MTEWRERTLGEVADYIEMRHHAFLREMLGRLEGLSSAARSAADAATLRTLDALEGVLVPFAIELEHHLMTEESTVFPLAREAEDDAASPDRAEVARQLIGHLETEHANAREALAKIRELTSDFTAPVGASAAVVELFDALSDLDADLREHIRLESSVLFPRVAAS